MVKNQEEAMKIAAELNREYRPDDEIEHDDPQPGWVLVDSCVPGLFWSDQEQAFRAHFKYHGVPTSKRFTVSARPYFLTSQEAEATARHFAEERDNVAKGAVVEMTVDEYCKLLPSVQKILLLYHADCLPFGRTSDDQLPVDPHFLGLWLGDGSRNDTTIFNNHEPEIVNFLRQHAAKLGLVVTITDDTIAYRTVNAAPGHANPLLDALRRVNLITPKGETGYEADRKHIPVMYKFASEPARLQLLAGLLDSHRTYIAASHEFIFTQNEAPHETLFWDVVFLARSLGFYCSTSRFEQTTIPPSASQPRTGIVLKLIISGDLERVPTLLPRKQARPRGGRDWRVTCIQLIEQQEQLSTYYGFQVDGNQRFLRDDFMVVHNSGFEESMKYVCDVGFFVFVLVSPLSPPVLLPCMYAREREKEREKGKRKRERGKRKEKPQEQEEEQAKKDWVLMVCHGGSRFL